MLYFNPNNYRLRHPVTQVVPDSQQQNLHKTVSSPGAPSAFEQPVITSLFLGGTKPKYHFKGMFKSSYDSLLQFISDALGSHFFLLIPNTQ